MYTKNILWLGYREYILIECKINKNYKRLKSFLLNIDDYFTANLQTIHKARNELKIINFQGIDTVVKAFKVPNIFNRMIYSFLRASKAKKSYENAMRLIELKINTPEPIGYIEMFRFGLFDKSYFISLFEPYDFTIREVFHHKVEDVENILRQFTQFTYDLHQKGVWHVDYSLGNILITKGDNGYKFSLVDINRMEFKKIVVTDGLKNFNKFWAKEGNDLVVIAKEYARLSGFDEDNAIRIVFEEQNKVMKFKNFKKNIKQKLGFK